MSISFGVATASLATAFFIPDRFHMSAAEMIHGIHKAFFVLGGLTALSTVIFRELKSMDGDAASQHKILQPSGYASLPDNGSIPVNRWWQSRMARERPMANFAS
jgi:hypothetical protein